MSNEVVYQEAPQMPVSIHHKEVRTVLPKIRGQGLSGCGRLHAPYRDGVCFEYMRMQSQKGIESYNKQAEKG